MVRIAACLKKAGVEPIVALKCVIVALIGGVLALFALLVLRFGPLWPCVCAVVLAVAGPTPHPRSVQPLARWLSTIHALQRTRLGDA